MQKMFSNENVQNLTYVDEDFIYIDRDPEIFKMVLQYLRNNQNYPEIGDPFLRQLFHDEI